MIWNAARGCPCHIAGRSLRPSRPPLARMQTALRHPGCACLHTPAPWHGQPLAPLNGSGDHQAFRLKTGAFGKPVSPERKRRGRCDGMSDVE